MSAGAVEIDAHFVLDDAHAGRVRALDVAGEHAGEPAGAIDGRRRPGSRRATRRAISSKSSWNGLPSMMPGPTLSSSIVGAVRAAHRLDAGEPGATAFAAARVARHEVRLDEPGDDLEIGGHEAAVEPDLGAARRAAEVHVLVGVARDVVAEAIARRRSSALVISTNSSRVLARCRPVATRISMRSRAMPARSRVAQDRRQDDAVGHRARLVGDHHHRVAPPARQLGQRRVPIGAASAAVDRARRDRPAARPSAGSTTETRSVVRQDDVKPAAPVVEADLHASDLADRLREG